MGPYTLTMGGNATNTGIGDVTGVITRNQISNLVLYTFGHAHTSIVFPYSGTIPTSMSLKVEIGTAPSWRAGTIQRTYDFIQTGGSGTKAVIQAHYLDSELNGNLESKLVTWAHIFSSSTTLEQGRSNFNTIDNWVELTNVNVGLYFAPIFGQVSLTLDEAEAGILTWNGAVSSSWTTAANWTPNATPSDVTAVYIPDANTTPNDPILNPAVLLGSLTIDAGGILISPDDAQFTINGGAGAWINNGTFIPGGGTSRVIFTNADATMGGVTDLNNFTINPGAGYRPMTYNEIRVSGSFVNNGTMYAAFMENTIRYTGNGQTLAIPNAALSAYHHLIIDGTNAVFPPTLNVKGDLTLNQPVDFNGKAIVMSGNHMQTVIAASEPNFYHLTINNSYGHVNLSANTKVNGTLTLTTGHLDIGNTTLTISNEVAGTFNDSTMIVVGGTGEVRRMVTAAGTYVFPIGEMTDVIDYTPITVSVNEGSFSNAFIGATVIDAMHPSNTSTDNNITRYWKVSQSGMTGAVATISSMYKEEDIVGAESDISAGQLVGNFNRETNPWIKYGALESNTLTATSASLLQGQPSYFTGIKGGTFTALVSGYGDFCQNESVTLSVALVGGDEPFTYQWSNGLGELNTATPSTSTVGTTTYSVTVTDSNGITAADQNDVVVLPPSVGGTLSSNQTICSGSVPSDIALTGYTGSVLYWQSASDATFTSPVNISDTIDILAGAEIGAVAATTYFRAVVENGHCGEVFSATAVVFVDSTTWDGALWSNGVPTSNTAIFAADYTTAGDLSVCSIIVTNGADVTIAAGDHVTINGALTVEPGSTYTQMDTASLIQLTNASNSGTINVKRNSSPLKRLDYTLWSSPVNGQLLRPFSPLTVATRFYTYDAATDVYAAVSAPATTPFAQGTGYLIRMPDNHPTSPTIWEGTFTGVPNNGPVEMQVISNTYNAVGNPYPSAIDADAFISANSLSEALYFWRKTNNAATTSYATYTLAGGVGTDYNSGDPSGRIPDGTIQVGQGFIAKAANGLLTFNNEMRIAAANGMFLRSTLTERHRVWLNLTNDDGLFSQTMVAYMDGATNDIDNAIDGHYINDSQTALTSIINDEEFAVQGRVLPFDHSDIVAIGFKSATAGSYSIRIAQTDGMFAEGQVIYLKDTLLNITHNLNEAPYTFVSEAGVFNQRFQIVYQLPLAFNELSFIDQSVVIYKQGESFILSTNGTIMNSLQVFDIRGRLLLEQKGINADKTTFTVGTANQVLIVKVTSDTGAIVTKKVVN